MNEHTDTEYCDECDREVLPIDTQDGQFKCPTHGWRSQHHLEIDGKRIGSLSNINLKLESGEVKIEKDTEREWTPNQMRLRIETFKKQLERMKQSDRWWSE